MKKEIDKQRFLGADGPLRMNQPARERSRASGLTEYDEAPRGICRVGIRGRQAASLRRASRMNYYDAQSQRNQSGAFVLEPIIETLATATARIDRVIASLGVFVAGAMLVVVLL